MRAHRADYPITTMCRVLEVSTSGYYAWSRRDPSVRKVANQQLGDRIETLHRQSRCTYGRPRIQADLRDAGIRVSDKRVARLRRERKLRGACRRKGFQDHGVDVTVTTNFEYTLIGYYPVSKICYAVTGYYSEIGRMGTGTSNDRMTTNCRIKASALESAEFNLGVAIITLPITGGAFVAAEAVTAGAATVAVGGLLAIELSVFSATDALQSARLDYREAGC